MPEPKSIADELAAENVRVVEPPKGGIFGRRKQAESKPKSAFQKTDKELKDALTKLFKDIAPGVTGLVPGADDYDRHIIEVNAKRLAETYTELAKASPPFRRFLEAVLTAGGPFAAAVFATMATVFPILHHHKIVSIPPALGVIMIGEPLETHETEVSVNGGSGQTENSGGNSGVTPDSVVGIP